MFMITMLIIIRSSSILINLPLILSCYRKYGKQFITPHMLYLLFILALVFDINYPRIVCYQEQGILSI